MTDAEIFHRNVRAVCREKDLRYTKVDKTAGYHQGNTKMMADRAAGVTTLHIKRYAKALGVKPERLMERMFE